MPNSTNLALPFLEAAQAQKHVTHNEALRILDALVQLAVLDRHLSAPPGAPAEGARWIVAAAPTGAWTGHANHIAAWQDGAWRFTVPKSGFVAFVVDEATLYFWNGAAWASLQGIITALQNLTLLGVGTTADATNPFSAKLNNALWVAKTAAEGGDGDLRYKMSKETAADVLSLLLQTNFSARAEFGLIGNDDVTLKVSPDGAAFHEAFVVDRTNGDFEAGKARLGRDMLFNMLPDSGRFNGNANNTTFSGIAYTAPTYFTPCAGVTMANHAKFIHDNSTYGGAGGALDAEINALISKIRAAGDRRYGPEWYMILVTMPASGLVEPQNFSGTDYGIPFTNTFTMMPSKFTACCYVRAKTGSIVLRQSGGRSYVDDVLMAGSQVLNNASGWKFFNCQGAPNNSQYDYEAFRVKAAASAEFWFAMPRLYFGHVRGDPNLGTLPNSKFMGG